MITDWEPQDLYNPNMYGSDNDILLDMGLSQDQVNRILEKYKQISEGNNEIYNTTNI